MPLLLSVIETMLLSVGNELELREEPSNGQVPEYELPPVTDH